jgi:hypothetical protein
MLQSVDTAWYWGRLHVSLKTDQPSSSLITRVQTRVYFTTVFQVWDLKIYKLIYIYIYIYMYSVKDIECLNFIFYYAICVFKLLCFTTVFQVWDLKLYKLLYSFNLASWWLNILAETCSLIVTEYNVELTDCSIHLCLMAKHGCATLKKEEIYLSRHITFDSSSYDYSLIISRIRSAFCAFKTCLLRVTNCLCLGKCVR